MRGPLSTGSSGGTGAGSGFGRRRRSRPRLGLRRRLGWRRRRRTLARRRRPAGDPQILREVLLASPGGILRSGHRVADVARLAERGHAVGDARGQARDLLDGLRDRGRDGTHGRVGAVGHRDGAVRDGVELVELVVDAVDRPAGLDDHGKQVALRPANERRDAAEQLAELEEHEERADPEQDEEDREGASTRGPRP